MYKHERTCIGKFIKGIFQRRINHKTVYKNTINPPGTKMLKLIRCYRFLICLIYTEFGTYFGNLLLSLKMVHLQFIAGHGFLHDQNKHRVFGHP